MIGRTYAFVTVVLVRSNSRTSGSSSDDSVTGTSGARARTIAAARCSWAPSA